MTIQRKCSRPAFKTGTVYASLSLMILLAGAYARAQGSGLARTPSMGWNTWYAFGCQDTEVEVRAAADAMISNGMRAAGYSYVNLDDCWQRAKRDAKGFIHPNANFPDMKALVEYVHSRGFKFGIYSSPGPKTCGGNPGSYGHEEQDAETYARWGVDFLKYDWCSAGEVYKLSQIPAAYEKMHEAILRTGRPMVYNLCEYGMEAPWLWGPKIGANSWRTTEDVSNRIDFQEYSRMMFVGFGQAGLGPYAGSGHWNDPDYLQIGNRGLNRNEDKTQMSLWCLLAAPLFSSTDLTKLTPVQVAILTNREVIAIDQDRLAVQGHRVSQIGPVEVWAKPLSGKRVAVGLFNSGESSLPASVRFSDVGFSGPVQVRDLWRNKGLGVLHNRFSTEVPKHGVVMIEIQSAAR
jgi:alpha-galactosidase